MDSRQKRNLIWGKVKKFNQRGRKLGFPTANLNINRPVSQGVYIGSVKIKSKKHLALIFIGRPLTFKDPVKRLEAYIPGLKENLYHQWISVKLLTKLRSNKKFKNKQELIKQIKKDLNVFRNYSKSTTNN